MALAPEAVTTFERVEGYRVVRSFGFAYGHASRPRNVLKQTFRSIGVLIGLAPIEYLTEAERARAESLDVLLRKAEAMGANGVLGLQFQASEAPDGATRVTAFGEAVLLDPAPRTPAHAGPPEVA
ncbi:MAG TPA: heavy metal-binding domain-containing protein [Candidatus Baltobacteraceae bacterium]|nr:heavy metal-binding domain-containing protein [Candidatus Baltobacteraceae bacterium]